MPSELTQIKKEMLELVSKNVDLDSPETITWMERAANLVRKDRLQPGQVWRHNAERGLEKVWVN